jgi:hypothetical protein
VKQKNRTKSENYKIAQRIFNQFNGIWRSIWLNQIQGIEDQVLATWAEMIDEFTLEQIKFAIEKCRNEYAKPIEIANFRSLCAQYIVKDKEKICISKAGDIAFQKIYSLLPFTIEFYEFRRQLEDKLRDEIYKKQNPDLTIKLCGQKECKKFIVCESENEALWACEDHTHYLPNNDNIIY